MRQIACISLVTIALTAEGALSVPVHGQTAPVAGSVHVNPNIAGEADLTRRPHMNAALANGLAARRPFADRTAVDTFLSSQGLMRTRSRAASATW